MSIICGFPKRPAKQFPQALGALGEHLIGMPVCKPHRRSHLLDIRKRHAFVEQITHRVDEYHLRLAPAQGFTKLLRNETQIEAFLEGMSFYSAETLGEPFRVAMLTTGTDLRAAANRVPGCVGPLDF